MRAWIRNVATFKENGGLLIGNRVAFQENKGTSIETAKTLIETVVTINEKVQRNATIFSLVLADSSVNMLLEDILSMHVSLITPESILFLIVYLDFVPSGYQFIIPI